MELNNINNSGNSNVNEFDMDKVKEMVRLSNLDDMDSYDNDTKILEFFEKVFLDDKSMEDGMSAVKEMVDNFIGQLVSEGNFDEDSPEGKISIYKLYPFFDLEDRITVKIIYLSIKYFYKNQLEASYKIRQNPNHIRICLTFNKK
ncbi:hypothetical protein vBSscSF1_54 [Staphylococcus phage vB-SscS-F1]|nr:hypothetical protein vBApySJF1_54 [Arcanobacterium phage vB-ApyS-JF1]